MSIKIIRTDSSSLDLRYSFIRFLGSVLCVATLGIGFIVVAFDSHKQGMHDRMADTYVVETGLFVILLRWVGRQSWPVTASVAILAAGGSYLLFARWLLVSLPAGLWAP